MPPPINGWGARLAELYATHIRRVPKPPLLSPLTAVLLSVLFTVIYVAPFYLSKATRPSPHLTRDAPSSIRARIRAVTFSCVVSVALTVYVLYSSGHVSPPDILSLFGVWSVSLWDTARTMLLLSILFAGPLFESGMVDGEWRDWVTCNGLYTSLSSWIGYRNYVVGPLSEEIIWRSLIIPLHVIARFSGNQIIFLTPLYFGIAHVHHLYEFRLTHPRTPLFLAVLRSLFQFTYTSLFGFFAAFVFLRTGNVYTTVLAHTFCNWMGLPRFYGRVGVQPVDPSGPSKKDDTRTQGKGIAWTVAYYVILVAGAVGFYWQLFPLTDSSHALSVTLRDE